MNKHERLRHELTQRALPTRVVNVLVNMIGYGGGETWPAIIDKMKADPDEFDKQFLRTPGAGRVSLAQLKTHADLRGLDHTGGILWLTEEDLQRVRDTIDEACGHCPESLCNELNAIKAFFTARTIHTRRV